MFTLDVSNVGTAATVDPIIVTDNLPTGLTLVSVTAPGWTCMTTLTTLSCTFSGMLDPGDSAPTIKVTVNVAPDAPPVLFNTATAESGTVEPITAEDSAICRATPVPAPALSHTGLTGALLTLAAVAAAALLRRRRRV
ncbi:MAG: hypothetical protein AB7V27_14215 [Candidatus Binatia bacterium]